MLRIKSTYTPENRLLYPQVRVNMIDIINYWSKPGCKFNYTLYLKFLEAKKEKE